MRLPPICVIGFMILAGAMISCSRDAEPTTFEEAKILAGKLQRPLLIDFYTDG